jgi:hypothetical protein
VISAGGITQEFLAGSAPLFGCSGTSKTWIERRTVTLELGNPGAVTLKVDGKTRAGLGSPPVTLRLSPAAGAG